MYNNGGFIQIKPEFFLKGMYIDSDVFYIQNNKPVLFCKQSVITDERLFKLKAIAETEAPIFVSKISYGKLMEQYERIIKSSERQEESFRNAKKEFSKMFDSLKQNGEIEMEEAVKLVQTVNETVEQAEVSFVIHWISYMRDADEYLYTHGVNVGILNGMMAKWLELSKEDEQRLILIGLLHDVGKTLIEDEIINKPARLTDEEFAEIKKHSMHSYELLKNSGITDELVLNAVRGHHEKGNGTGYPDGLSLDEIPLFARITSISDIYDAMVAKRVYKEANSPFQVLDEFYRNKFSDLDIRLVDLFLDKMENELVGKDVILSNGKIARIVYLEKTNFAYPIVQCDNNVIVTSEELKCVTLSSNLG